MNIFKKNIIIVILLFPMIQKAARGSLSRSNSTSSIASIPEEHIYEEPKEVIAKEKTIKRQPSINMNTHPSKHLVLEIKNPIEAKIIEEPIYTEIEPASNEELRNKLEEEIKTAKKDLLRKQKKLESLEKKLPPKRSSIQPTPPTSPEQPRRSSLNPFKKRESAVPLVDVKKDTRKTSSTIVSADI